VATYTITTAVNIDSLAAKVGSDVYNINGGYLTIDQDTRYGTNQNVSAGMGNITLSATLGGTIDFNATLVRIIPYNTGAGNVPAYGTVISQGGASGTLIGVYASLAVAPTAPAAAMPASGFIKIRQWNSVAYAAGALTGISASATGADRAGWLEVVGVDALSVVANRLGTFRVRGDWFALGTTNGVRATTYQIPSNGSIVYLPGVWVETGIATNVYEFYPCAGSVTALAANVATDAVRGRWCWISTAGLLRFGHDGVNSTGGHIPSTGRRVRIPSIFFVCCTAAALTANVLPNATLATRYEFSTTGGGVLDIQNACFNWYLNLNQPYSVALTNVGVLTNLTLTECATPIVWSHVGVGQEAANTQFGFLTSLCFAGGTLTNCTWTRATLAASGSYVTSHADISGFTMTSERVHALGGARGNATTGSQNLVRASRCTWTNCLSAGGRVLLTTCTDCTFTNTTYYDHPATTTPVTNAQYLFNLVTNCLRVTADGVTFGGLTLCQPYAGIMSIGAAGCTDTKLRNLGTAAAPLDMGNDYVLDAAWSRTTTVMTITRVAHGLKVNDLVAVMIASDVAPRAVTTTTATLWTVATVPTADTFTVTVTSAGATTGTLSYYPTMAASLLVLATGAAANTVKVQRCYVPHLRATVFSGDNSSKSLLFDNVWGSDWGALLVPMLDCTIRGVQSNPALTAQTSTYGTHWIDYAVTEATPNLVAVAWTRATTTATVTSTGHNLRTGVQVLVTVTSDAAAIVLGIKTITATTSNAFTFACLNAGAASGTLSFTPMVTRIAIQMNEETAATADQVTVDGGTPGFTSAGSLYMPAVNDQVTFEMPDYLLGHTSFPAVEAVMAGGTITNHDITYAIDENDGLGYSAFKNLSYPRAGGGGASASTNVTMTSTTGVAVDDFVFGTGIAPLAKVASITNATTIVVTIANIGTVSGILRFNQMPNETISPTAGIRLKVRIKTTTVNVAAITSLYLTTAMTTAGRAVQYTLDPVPVTITALDAATGAPIQNVRVYLEATGGGPSPNGTVLMSRLTDVTGKATDATYAYVGNQQVTGRARKGDAVTRYKTGIVAGTITATGLEVSVYLVADE